MPRFLPAFLRGMAALGAAGGASGAVPTLSWRSGAVGKEIALAVHPSAGPAPLGTVIFLERLSGPVGTGSAGPIQLAELAADGLTVITADYARDPRACSPRLNQDFLELRRQLPSLAGVTGFVPGRCFILPAGYRLFRDVPYYEEDGHRFALDVWLPPAAGRAPLPCLLQFAHNNASRMAAPNFVRYTDTLIEGFATLGFGVAMADHPMPPPAVSTYKMPEVVYKARAAVRTLRAAVAAAGIVPGKVGVVGFSRAAAIAALAAMAGPAKIAGDAGPHRDFGESVEAALCASGRYDLLGLDDPTDAKRRDALIAAWGDPETHAAEWREASPLTYASADSAPIFLTVGGSDLPFRVRQAHTLADALAAAGVAHPLAVEPGMRHALPTNPSTLQRLNDFFVLHLGGPR